MSNTGLSGIEQGRAAFAYQKVTDAVRDLKKDEQKKKYRAHVKDVPMMIKTNGLGATFAFILSKREKEQAYEVIYEQTEHWLKDHQSHLLNLSGNKDFVEEIVKLKSHQYRAVTVEVLALFVWLRRFAEGLIKEDTL